MCARLCGHDRPQGGRNDALIPRTPAPVGSEVCCEWNRHSLASGAIDQPREVGRSAPSVAHPGAPAKSPRPLQLALVFALLAAAPAFAQPPALEDSTLDNLVHAPDYVSCAPGTLGAVVERGRGPVDMILVSGFGVG